MTEMIEIKKYVYDINNDVIVRQFILYNLLQLCLTIV